MNCRRVSSLISAYIDGELTGVEMLEIRGHLGECRSCMLQYESLRTTKQVLSSLNTARPSADFTARLYASLDLVEVPGYQRALNHLIDQLRAKITPLAAGCIALGGIFVILSTQSVRGPEMVALERSFDVSNMKPSSYASANLQPVRYEDPQPTRNPEPYTATPIQPYGSNSGVFINASFEDR